MSESIFDQHPDEDVLEKYLMAQLDSPEAVEEHLLICHACLEKVAEMEIILEAVRLTDNRTEIKPFRTHLPLYGLEAAAGKFGRQQMDVDPEGWIEVPQSHIPMTQDMFVIHIEGFSMEPAIPDGSLCAFKAVVAPYDGKVVLMEQNNRYTVKRYRSSTHGDLHTITLESTNPAFEPWDVASSSTLNILGEFAFVLNRGASLESTGA